MASIRNVAELAEDALARQGERTTILYDGERVTNAAILREGRALHGVLKDLGVGLGDVGALCMINHKYVYSVFTGVFRTGATVVPAMFGLSASELRYIFEWTEAKVVFTDLYCLDKVREAIKGLPHVRFLFINGGEDDPNATPREYSLEQAFAHAEESTFTDAKLDDMALMLFTSGTTGQPKGVMLSHGAIIAHGEAILDASELDAREHPIIQISALPMAHIFGIGRMNYGYMVPKEYADGFAVQEQRFEPERFMARIQEHRCTDAAMVPTMLAMILSHPKFSQYDLTSLVKIDIGAAPVPVELGQRFSDACGCRIRQVYGMTENAGIASADRITMPYHPGSAGRPYFNVDLRIFDDDGKELAPGQPGEVVTRGPSTMMGYYKRPEETAQTLRNGWLHTGDIGYLDEDGWLYIVDRKKDMIIKGGENIFPAEVENALYQFPHVVEAAVVGVPHDTYGEDIHAFVVLREPGAATEEELIQFVKGSISPFKAPGRVVFLEALPKSGVGKVLRRELRERAAEMAEKI